MKYYYIYETKIGKILLAEEEGHITNLYFDDQREVEGAELKETALIREAKKQLDEYLLGRRKEFNLPLKAKGTEFQQRVWQALLDIPYGETKSYGEIAKIIGNPKAARAVGLANNRNPISIFIPCHRVIGKNGKLVGYGGGLQIKEFLLTLERKNCNKILKEISY
ncbi:MAG: methylated-DNA--[protein]-cysteine S-methyltransferase [Tissierellia bacterium]|nr:methylated-DNA--[protein]-cysteine S-methyltransferase [Tissierellia bacterium]